jgi:hypothetical protein
LRPKSKIENGNLFAKNFAWYLVSFCKMMDQNPNFFWVKWETKHTLIIKFILLVVSIVGVEICLLLCPLPKKIVRCYSFLKAPFG